MKHLARPATILDDERRIEIERRAQPRESAAEAAGGARKDTGSPGATRMSIHVSVSTTQNNARATASWRRTDRMWG